MTRRGESDDQTPPRPGVTPGAMRTQLIHMPDRLHPWFLAPLEPPRASFEFGLTMALAPVLVAAHAADGHPVLVVPGLSGGDQWTLFIRGYLRAIGHSVFTPSRGTMRRRPAAVVARLNERVDELQAQTGRTVSLVGWSVGGCFVRQVAMSRSTAVRRVITLGTPLNGAFWYGTPEGHSRVRDMPVPVTAIYSRSDGIFDWRRCVQWPTASVDNAVIPSSHLGMASHPMALHIIADRLSRPAEPTG